MCEEDSFGVRFTRSILLLAATGLYVLGVHEDARQIRSKQTTEVVFLHLSGGAIEIVDCQLLGCGPISHGTQGRDANIDKRASCPSDPGALGFGAQLAVTYYGCFVRFHTWSSICMSGPFEKGARPHDNSIISVPFSTGIRRGQATQVKFALLEGGTGNLRRQPVSFSILPLATLSF